MGFPVRTVTRPAVILGRQNGKLPATILLQVPGQSGGPTVRLVGPALRAWKALCAEALSKGHVLKSTSLNDSYRPYDVQKRIPDTTKATRVLGFEATTRLETMLDEVIPWVENEIHLGRI